jgi:hypothetical protein
LYVGPILAKVDLDSAWVKILEGRCVAMLRPATKEQAIMEENMIPRKQTRQPGLRYALLMSEKLIQRRWT